MRRGFCAAIVAAAALFSLTSATAEAPARFMSLKGQEAEGRNGPGPQHAVAWVYQRAGLPMQVVSEMSGWLRVRDPDGDETWMAAADLEPRRTTYVRQQTTLRRSARSGAQPVAYLMPGVIGAVTGCEGDWRRVAVGGRVGWVESSALWGASCPAAAIRP
jgi:SH3-like domain-containing protein